ncbi:MAG: 16S rRNA (cytosine(967)-C(5))-methyltransferase RsmB [Myxococcota bacterium]
MADARDVALEVLRRVFTQGAFASAALRSELGRGSVKASDRGLATEIVYGVLRRRAFLDAALAHVSGRRFKDVDPRAHDILRVAAYQIMYLDRVPAFAAVDRAVNQAKRRRAHSGFVNAVLRKLADRSPESRLPPAPDHSDPIRRIAFETGLPTLLTRTLVDDLGLDDARAYGLASLDPAPLTLRVNRLRATPEDICEEVGGVRGTLPYAIRLPHANQLPAEFDCVKAGRATPQDEASMRVVELLAPEPGDLVLDVCSAPGGKTTHMAERMNDQGKIMAYDRLPSRLARVSDSSNRLGLRSIETIDILPERAPVFDRVLVDAPCSGLGTLRRHPELRWKFDPRNLPDLARTQAEVLAEGAERVRPGGVLVYSVCTVSRLEGPDRLEVFGPDWELEAQFVTGPHQEGRPDGFFAARLRRVR